MDWNEFVENYDRIKSNSEPVVDELLNGICRDDPHYFIGFNDYLLDEFKQVSPHKTFLFIYPYSTSFLFLLLLRRTLNEAIKHDNADIGIINQLKDGSKVTLGRESFFFSGMSFENARRIVYLRNASSRGTEKYGNNLEKIPPFGPAFEDAIVQKGSVIKSLRELTAQWESMVGDASCPVGLTKKNLCQSAAWNTFTRVIVTKPSLALHRLEEIRVFDHPITDFISVLLLGRSGQKKSFGGSRSNPQIVLAPTIDAANHYRQDGNRVDVVYFDLDRIDSVIDEFDSLGDLEKQENGTAPSLIFTASTSMLSKETRERFESCGVPIFTWTIKLALDKHFYDLDVDYETKGFLRRFCRLKIRVKQCQSKDLEEAKAILFEANNRMADEGTSVNEAFYRLWQSFFLICHAVVPFHHDDAERIIFSIENASDALLSKNVTRYMADESLANSLIEAANILRVLANPSLSSHPKAEAIYSLLSDKNLIKGKKVALICSSDCYSPEIHGRVSEGLFKKGIDERKDMELLSVLTASELLANGTSYDLLLLTYWPGMEEAQHILFSNFAESYYLFLYPFEIQWLSRCISKWKKDNVSSNIAAFLPQVSDPGDSTVDIEFDLPEKGSVDDDLEAETRKAALARFKNAFTSEQNDHDVSARLIRFADEFFGAYTDGFTFTCITDGDGVTDYEAEEIRACELKPGHIVLLIDSDHDAICQLSEKDLESKGKTDLEEIASSWRLAFISAKQKGLSEEAIISAMQKAGVKRSTAEFRIWLDEKSSLLCPRDLDSLLKIGAALKDDELIKDAEEIIKAADEIRTSRRMAGKTLSKMFSSNPDLKSAIQRIAGTSGSIHSTVNISIPGVGNVMITRVIQVGNPEFFPSTKVNRRMR